MKLLFQLSGENPKLAEAEVRCLFEAYDVKYERIYFENQIAIFKADFFSELERLALTKRILNLDDLSLKPSLSFRVRVKSINSDVSSLRLERELSEELIKRYDEKLKVNLKNPEQEICAIALKERRFVGKTYLENREKFEVRKPQNRPFKKPLSLHPKFARLICNLSRAKREVLDPFCGTGGILIEAGLMGLKPLGLDISEEMVLGCTQNLLHFNIENFDVKEGDCRFLKDYFSKVEAVATDVPYGRGSFLSEKKEDLYQKAFESIREISKTSCIVTSCSYDFESLGFEVLEIYNLKVHRSLTRFFHILDSNF
ncbi:MAG: THUMP domain-containing protein [Candidatus Methanofastidiosia archaeon]